MDNEEKVVEAEVVGETEQKSAMDVKGNKNSLVAFILAVIGFGFACAWYVAVVGVVLGIISLCFLNKPDKADRKPWTVFNKFSKPFAIVSIVLGAVMFTIGIIVTALMTAGIIAGVSYGLAQTAGTSSGGVSSSSGSVAAFIASL